MSPEMPMPGPSPRPRPTHRHGRRVQREALVVVVTGPVQRVLELRPRTPLGLADPLLALVVHPPGITSCSRDDLRAPRFLLPTHPLPSPGTGCGGGGGGGGGTQTPFALARRL